MLQVNSDGDGKYNYLDGKVIKLWIRCRDKHRKAEACVLFKMKGSFSCKYMLFQNITNTCVLRLSCHFLVPENIHTSHGGSLEIPGGGEEGSRDRNIQGVLIG